MLRLQQSNVMNESMANIILQKVMEIGEVTAKMGANLQSLVENVDEHHNLIVETRNDVKKIVDKQNQDYAYFVKNREDMLKELNGKIDPMWEEHEKKAKLAADVRGKTWDMIWEWARVAVVFGAGYLLTSIYEIVKAFKK